MDAPTEIYSYSNYYREVKEALSRLVNAKNPEDQAILLSDVNALDLKFMQSRAQINTRPQKIYFTRHAKCTASDKVAGLAPNTPVDEEALKAISQTNKITRYFLQENEANNTIVISPMLRARQTAGKLIPHDFSGNIEIQHFVTENSLYPSGKPIRNTDELQQGTNLWFQVSSNVYTNEYFKNIEALSNQADREILEKSLHKKIDIPETISILDEEKIGKITDYIKHKTGDIWVIGHGKNITNYFKTCYQMDESLSFCETRKVWRYQVQDTIFEEFVVPYILIVDQNTGLMKADILPPQRAPGYRSSLKQELEVYIPQRMEEHQDPPAHPFKLFTQIIKETMGVDYETKINAARKLSMLLDNKPLSEGLTALEIKALMSDRLGMLLEKYQFNLKDFLEKQPQPTNIRIEMPGFC